MTCLEDAQYYWGTKHAADTCTSHVLSTGREKFGSYERKTWCTRPKKHKGLHHCHSNANECVRTWTTEETIIDAL